MRSHIVETCPRCKSVFSAPRHEFDNDVQNYLRAWGVPSQHVLSDISRKESRICADVACYDHEIGRLLAIVDQLRVGKDELESHLAYHRSLRLSIRKLSHEILEKIFSYSPDPASPSVFARVCTRWRDVVLSSAALSTNISLSVKKRLGELHSTSMQSISSALQRSKAMPLQVTFDSSSSVASEGYFLQQAALLFQQGAHRMTHLNLESRSIRGLSNDPSLEFPALVELCLTCPSSEDDLLLFKNTPRLETLVIQFLHTDFIDLPLCFQHITRLKLKWCDIWVAANLISTYVPTSMHSEVHLVACDPDSQWENPSSIACNATSLWFLEDEEAERAEAECNRPFLDHDYPNKFAVQVFSRLQAPRLRELVLWGVNSQAGLNSKVFHNFLSSVPRLSRLEIGPGPYSSSVCTTFCSGITNVLGLLECTPHLMSLALHDDDVPHHSALISSGLLRDLTVYEDIVHSTSDALNPAMGRRRLPRLKSLSLTIQRCQDLHALNYRGDLLRMIQSRWNPPLGVSRLEQMQLSVARSSVQHPSTSGLLTVEDVLDDWHYARFLELKDDGLEFITTLPPVDLLADEYPWNARELIGTPC